MKRDNAYLIGNQHAKGHRPWNKGKPLPAMIGNQFAKGNRANRTSFQPGHTLTPGFPIGTITVRKTKGQSIRNFIKTLDGTWEEYANWLWKQYYGRLLPSDVVHHINGKSLDDRIDNLIALPRSDHPIFHNKWGLVPLSDMQMETYLHRYPTTTRPD